MMGNVKGVSFVFRVGCTSVVAFFLVIFNVFTGSLSVDLLVWGSFFFFFLVSSFSSIVFSNELELLFTLSLLLTAGA